MHFQIHINVTCNQLNDIYLRFIIPSFACTFTPKITSCKMTFKTTSLFQPQLTAFQIINITNILSKHTMDKTRHFETFYLCTVPNYLLLWLSICRQLRNMCTYLCQCGCELVNENVIKSHRHSQSDFSSLSNSLL